MNLERQKNTLGDLAHSLKTPLAVLQGYIPKFTSDEERATAQEQIDSMGRLVDHQLKKAASTGPRTLSKPVQVAGIVAKIIRSLRKLYSGKHIAFEQIIDEQVQFFGDQGDFWEVVGNLLENACKYGRGSVRVTIHQIDEHDSMRKGISITVEDDGPGMSEEQFKRLTRRGVRGDQKTPGQGIGLSVISQIVAVYDGRLMITKSSLGGSAISIVFPSSGTA